MKGGHFGLTNPADTPLFLFQKRKKKKRKMSYAAKDGKDTIVFVDKEYVDQQPEITAPKTEEKEEEPKDQGAAYDPETGEINWDCPCKNSPWTH